MLSREFRFKKDYATVVFAFGAAFPYIKPPNPTWIFLWIEHHPVEAIVAAIEQLGQHPIKKQFTTTSTGKAISALLKTDALKRAQAAILQSGVSR